MRLDASRRQTDLAARQPRETYVAAPRAPLSQDNFRDPNVSLASVSNGFTLWRSNKSETCHLYVGLQLGE